MLFFYSLIQPLMSFNLAAQDLIDITWSVSSWSAITSGGTTTSPYNQISNLCNNQNMLQLTNQYQTYYKTYTITDYEFYQLFIELDVYFYTFTQTTINIIVNAQNIYSQQFTSSMLTLNNICGSGSDSQYTIFQGFYTTQQTLIIQIQYTQNTVNANSYAGIKNLNIYSNGIPLIGGCPMSTPLMSAGVCVGLCTTTNPYLTGQYWNQCATGANAGSGFKNNLQTNVNTNFVFQDASNVVNSNLYTSAVAHNIAFNYLNQRTDLFYGTLLSGISTSCSLQLNFIFYVFGDWNDGSYVAINLAGNNMIVISKTNGQYISSTQSTFYKTNVTYSGTPTTALKTLISFSGRFYIATVQFCVNQVLYGSTASYGFGNILVYRALTDPNILAPNTDIYGFPFACQNSLFAYNGTCVSSCPVYSFISIANRNCTDYAISESSIYNSAIPIAQNAYGTYIIKQFYQNNFQQSDIDLLFQTKPPTSKNYLNGESFSFISSKKILGGYNSWGYGTYQAQFTNLKAHFQIRFYFTLYMIDGWQVGDSFTYQVDGVLVDTYTKNPTTQYQGLSEFDSIYVISGRKVIHGSSTLTISFNCNIALQDSSKASCGIQNLFVLIDQNINILCPLSTQFFSYTSQNCETCKTSPCQLFPSNTITAKCSIGCLTCTSSTVCTACDTSNGYQLSQEKCKCQTNYILESSLCQKCYYQCMTCTGIAPNLCSSCDATRTLTGTSCPCNSNYYDVQSVTACAVITTTCHYSCDTCYGLQYYQCVTCPASSNRTFQALSNTCPCDATYSDNGVALCVSLPTYTCDTTCLTCSAAGSSNCTSCDSTKNRSTLTTGQCPCDSGFNDIESPGNACVANYSPCHYSCDTCYGSSNNNCLTCSSANFRTISSNQCLCNNEYLDITIAQCAFNYTPCHYSCLTCYGQSFRQCIACPSTRNLNVVTLGDYSTCVCQDGNYDNWVTTCVTCDPTCQTCTAAGSDQCSSCDSTKHRTFSGSSCPCSDGFNEIVNPGTCVQNYSPCHQQCDTCYGPLSSDCITCNPTTNRQFDTNYKICLCQNDYIEIGLLYCVLPYSPCDSSCVTCFGDQIDQCLTCTFTRTLNIISPGNQVCKCNPQYYEVVGQSECNPCYYTCTSCNRGTEMECQSCMPDRELVGGQCLCIANYNDLNGTISECIQNYSPCDLSCLTCYGANADQCLDCPSESLRTYNKATATCDCPAGYDGSSTICTYTCHATCLTCVGPNSTDCVTCDTSVRQLQSTSCVCNLGTNDILDTITCVPDLTTCYASFILTCFGTAPNQALSCDASVNRILNGSICICAEGYNENFTTLTCMLCNSSCKTCYGNTNQSCLTCDTTMNRVAVVDSQNSCPCLANYNDVLNLDQACVADLTTCHFSCLTCYGLAINQCLTCSDQSLRILQQFSCNCMDGYFDNNYTQCLQCDSKCELCLYQSDICTQCNSNNFRYLQESKCVCFDGYYDNNQPVCQVCNEDCEICNKDECLNCKSSQRQLVNGQCLCYEGYYLKNQDCYQCEGFCTTCIGSPQFQCLSCGINRIILNNQCVCKKGYFNYNNNCLECQYSEGKQYKECLYQNDNDGVWTPGEQCDDGNKISRDGCSELKIDDGYYCDNIPMTPSVCYKCPDNCDKCQQNNGKVYCLNCMQKYFENQNYCYKCQENCLNCLSYSFCRKCIYNIQPIDGKCQICEPGYKQQGKTCQSICGDGIITKEEQCDDHNLYDNDGCSSKCQIEQGYICNPQCRLEQNDIKAKLVKSATSTNNIQIEILNYIFDLTQLEIKIDLFSINQDYQYKVSSINQNKFEIAFEFNKPIKSFNIIHIYIPIKQNKRLLDYIVRELSLIPEEANYYDSTQQSQRQNIKQTQQQFYQSLLYIGPIAFLLGGTSFFIQILDILSWINNFYYINVNYPGNVEIFFQQSNWGLIFSLPQILQFSIQDNNQQLPQKFQDKGVDSLILNNIQQTLLTFIMIVVGIPLSQQSINLIKWYTNKKNKKKINYRQDMQCDIMPVLSQNGLTQSQSQQLKQNYFVASIQNQLQIFYNNRYVILFKVININILDICLAIIINLKYQKYFQETIQIICFVFCLIMAVLCITYFYFLYFIAQLHKTVFRFKQFKNLYNQLFEGIKSDQISRLYGFQSIFQKSLFIISIVIFFEKPVQQTLFCSSILTGLLVLATFQNPFRKKEDIVSQFIPDILLTFILLLSTKLAADEQVNKLTNQDRYNIGWVILSFIGISILIQLLFIFKEAFEQLQIKYKWIKSICL